MTMTPRGRKLALVTHITSSAGWLGAVVAYLVLAVTGLTSHRAEVMRATYVCMKFVGWLAIVPCSVGALLTGIIESFGTEWGLFRHHWVQTKFFLTVTGMVVLLVHIVRSAASHGSPNTLRSSQRMVNYACFEFKFWCTRPDGSLSSSRRPRCRCTSHCVRSWSVSPA